MKKHEYIVNWLNDYSNNSKTNGFVIGISGGVDSAVVSTLCALTGKRVLCVSMSIYQNENEYNRGSEHINWLKSNFSNVESLDLNLTDPFDAIAQVLPKEVQNDHLSMANTRSRLRMTTLYALACTNKLLVAGTGNKVEDFGVGFFTKYGDGGVDLSPIADLMKSEVRAMAKELGIIEAIVTAKPTDGLWDDGRSDEDQIGATYDELEWAMRYTTGINTLIALSDRQQQVLEIYKRFNTANKHKMLPIPVCELPKDELTFA